MTVFPNPILPAFVLFCRVGACLLAAPGVSSDRVPLRARLYLALAITIALTPPLMQQIDPALGTREPIDLAATIIAELMIGVVLGLLARFYFLALETLATSVALAFGLGNIFGGAVNEPEPTPALASFVLLCAVTLFFVSDQHLLLLRAIYLSYETAPVAASPSPRALLIELTNVLTQSHLIALRLCSPFLIFGLVLNVALGLLSRLTPQVQVYFVSTPLAALLGVYSLSVIAPDFFAAFSADVGGWLLRGR